MMKNDQLLNSNVEPRVIAGDENLQPSPLNPPRVERCTTKKIIIYFIYFIVSLPATYFLYRTVRSKLFKWFNLSIE